MNRSPLPDYGDHMTLREFVSSVQDGILTPDDGSGRFATETEMFKGTDCFDFKNRPKEATHVVWFNK